MKKNEILFQYTLEERSWKLIRKENWYKIICVGPDITWSQKYPLHFIPEDILKAECAFISQHIKCLLSPNKYSDTFLNDTLSYIMSKLN